MSPETAKAVRETAEAIKTAEAVLLNVCGDTNEVQPTQLVNRGESQGVSGAANGASELHTNHRSREGPSALSMKRQARQDQVTTMCCENPACKKARLMQKKGVLHLLAFFCYLCLLISCIYARVLCILACCFDGMSLLLLSHVSAKSISYLIVLWSADRTVYLLIESETGGIKGVILTGIVIAPTVDMVLLGPMFFVEDG